jgi:hypothetical protein
MGRLEDVEAELAGLESGLDLPKRVLPPRELHEHVEFVAPPKVSGKLPLEESILKGVGDLNDLIEAASALKGSLLDIMEQLRKRN